MEQLEREESWPLEELDDDPYMIDPNIQPAQTEVPPITIK